VFDSSHPSAVQTEAATFLRSDGTRQQYHTVSQRIRPHSEYAWGENLRCTAVANVTKTESVIYA